MRTSRMSQFGGLPGNRQGFQHEVAVSRSHENELVASGDGGSPVGSDEQEAQAVAIDPHLVERRHRAHHANLFQAQLADWEDLARDLTCIENGDQNVSLKTIQKICDRLKVDVADLFPPAKRR